MRALIRNEREWANLRRRLRREGQRLFDQEVEADAYDRREGPDLSRLQKPILKPIFPFVIIYNWSEIVGSLEPNFGEVVGMMLLVDIVKKTEFPS